jgi:hypothetical protein
MSNPIHLPQDAEIKIYPFGMTSGTLVLGLLAKMRQVSSYKTSQNTFTPLPILTFPN